MRESVAGLAAPELSLGGTGAFPGWRRPRVLWVGVREAGAPGRLETCRGAVERAAARAGIEPGSAEEVFLPHVTVARPRDRGGRLEGFRELGCELPWTPAAVALFASRSLPGGARYEVLERFPFASVS